MNRIINSKEIDYVLFHLHTVVDIEEIKKNLIYRDQSDSPTKEKDKIIFKLSSSDFEISQVKYLNSVPILFSSEAQQAYRIDQNHNLIFDHDLLKSVFYLLSGYDEQYVNDEIL